ncbi:MAG: amidohydrolase family protein [Actinomycetota bacterium]|nr:amidohydrolase family protein [Actinomycetota bacterium]
MTHDLVIRNGIIVDGSGSEPYQADVAIDGDLIVAITPRAADAASEIDAQGMLVTPGFVDLHTHYDAQVTWDPVLAPSAWHGVTTIVMGNCGVGFAPVQPVDRSWMIEIMQEVEEIPRAVLESGLTWDWQTFPEYLDALSGRSHTVDICAQVPHIALRHYVMGERAARDEPATADDIAAMAGVVEEALRAGANGFACSRTDAHRLADGRIVPGADANRDELLGIADGVQRAGHGPIQFLGNFGDWDANLDFMIQMSRRAATSVHFTMSDTEWPSRLAGIDRGVAEKADLVGHFPPRAVGNVLQWRSSRHPFMDRPSIRAIAALPWPERVARLKDPSFRSRVLSEPNGEGEDLLPDFARIIYQGFDRMYEVDAYPDYEPDPTRDSIAARAAAAGEDPAAFAYDIMSTREGEGMIYMTLANYRTGDLSAVTQILDHPGTIVSLSDGGAHCTRVIDASAPTFMLAHWSRDRSRGDRLPLARVVKSCSRDPAEAYGLLDRGLIQTGYLADLNVIDFDHLRLPAPYLAFDLPAGGQRLLQRAEGYAATVKRGQIVFRDGAHQGHYPGQVVRGPQPQPTGA